MISETLDRCYAGGWASKNPFDDYWYESRGVDTVAGVDIDEHSAMTFSDVFACVNKVSKTIATLPLQVYEKTDAKTREPRDHPLNDLLTTEANEDAMGLTVRETNMASILRWGHAFNAVDWDAQGQPARITPLPADEMDDIRRDPDTGELLFVHRPPGGQPKPIPADRMWYIPGLSFNGITGVSPIAYNREAIGMGLAAQEFRSAFFGNGAWAGGFIQRPVEAPALSREAAQQWLDSLNAKFRGASKAFGFALLREGMEFTQLKMPFEDAMFLATARLTRTQICGIYDVPLSKIQDDERNTYSNAEQNDLVWAKDCLLPWCVRLETSARRRFFKGTKFYLRHNLAGVMRGDFKTRMEGYNMGLNWGLWSINEVRALEDMNPIDEGNIHYRPLNMGVLGQPNVQIASNGEAAQQMALVSYLAREMGTQRVEQAGSRLRFEQLAREAIDASQKQGRVMVRIAKTMRHQIAELGQASDRRAGEVQKDIADAKTELARGSKEQATRLGDAMQEGFAGVVQSQGEAAHRITASVEKLADSLKPSVADILAAFRPAIQHAAAKIATRQIKAITTAFQKHAKGGSPESFAEWTDKFLASHARVVRAEIEPVLRGYEDAMGKRLGVTAQDVADRYCEEIGALLVAGGVDGVPGALEDWNDNLAAGIVERLVNVLTLTPETKEA